MLETIITYDVKYKNQNIHILISNFKNEIYVKTII